MASLPPSGVTRLGTVFWLPHGSCRATDGAADVSVRHDAYLSDVFARD